MTPPRLDDVSRFEVRQGSNLQDLYVEVDLRRALGTIIVARPCLRDVRAPSIGAISPYATDTPCAKSRCHCRGPTLL